MTSQTTRLSQPINTDLHDKIAKIINDNLGNRITLELGNGLYSSIMKVIEDGNTTRTDTEAKLTSCK